MATALNLDLDTPQTSIVAKVEANPVMVLTDREQFSRFYEEIKRETDALDADVTTEKGRKAIASMAYKVARTKTAIDEAGKKLNEEARARINAVDEARREIRAQLDTLKDEVRAPLTEWEKAEEARVERVKAVIELLRSAGAVGYDETSAQVRERLATVRAMPVDPVEFDGYHPQAMALQASAVEALAAAAERIEAAEAKEMELQRLRAAEEARLLKEADERAERERIEQERIAAEQERIAAEQAEKRRQEAEEAEAARIRAAEERAAQAARDEEARKAREAEEARQREHEAALAEERRQREEVEATAQRERDERARQDAKRAAEAKRIADEAEAKRREDEARAKNRAHKTSVQTAAKQAIMTCGADEETARKIVLAIIAGEIPRVTLAF
jgi:colicin import membrane protein